MHARRHDMALAISLCWAFTAQKCKTHPAANTLTRWHQCHDTDVARVSHVLLVILGLGACTAQQSFEHTLNALEQF